MFKMGCSMARKILASSSSSQHQQNQQANSIQNETGQARTKTEEINDFSKLEQDPRIPLNVRQIFKITKSWKAIARTMSKTGTAMFLNLFEQNEDLFYLFDRFQHLKGRELHESMELREHAATVMSTLDQSINSLSDYDNFVTYLHSIGELHRKVPGFKREHFWKIEQPFMRAIKQTLDERCNETIEEIYKIAIKLIIETIADGYGQDTDTSATHRSQGGGDDTGSGKPASSEPGSALGSGKTPLGASSSAGQSSREATQSSKQRSGAQGSAPKSKTGRQLEQALYELKLALESSCRSCGSTCASQSQQWQQQKQQSYYIEQSEWRPNQTHNMLARPCNLLYDAELVKESAEEHLQQVCCTQSDNQEAADYKDNDFQLDREADCEQSAWPLKAFIGTSRLANNGGDEAADDLMRERHQSRPRSVLAATMADQACKLGLSPRASLTIQSGAPEQPSETALRPANGLSSSAGSSACSRSWSFAQLEHNRASTTARNHVKVELGAHAAAGLAHQSQLNQGQAGSCPWHCDQGGSKDRVGSDSQRQMPANYHLPVANTKQTRQSNGAPNQASAKLAKLGKANELIAQKSSLDACDSTKSVSQPGKASVAHHSNGHEVLCRGRRELGHQSPSCNPGLPLHQVRLDPSRAEKREQRRSSIMDSSTSAHYDPPSKDNLAPLIRALMFAMVSSAQRETVSLPLDQQASMRPLVSASK